MTASDRALIVEERDAEIARLHTVLTGLRDEQPNRRCFDRITAILEGKP